MKIASQYWDICEFEWGLEDLVVIDSLNARLILMEIGDDGVSRPVKISVIKKCSSTLPKENS